MDTLPDEMVANVLQFLPGSDVLGYRRLSHRFKNVIQNYHTTLNRPEVSLELDWNRCSVTEHTTPGVKGITLNYKALLRVITSKRAVSLSISLDCVNVIEILRNIDKKCEKDNILDGFERAMFTKGDLKSRTLANFLARLLEMIKVKEIRFKMSWHEQLLSVLSAAIGNLNYPIHQYRSNISLYKYVKSAPVLWEIPATSKVLVEAYNNHWQDMEALINDQQQTTFVAPDFSVLIRFMKNMADLWKQKQLNISSMSLILIDEKTTTFAYEWLTFYGADIEGSNRENLMYARTFKDFPPYFKLIDRHDNRRKMSFFFKCVDSVPTVNITVE